MSTKRHIPILILFLFKMLPSVASSEELPFLHMTTEGNIPLPSGSVQDILQDRLGFVWLAFYTSGISRFDGYSMEHFSSDDGVLDATVRELVEDEFGHLWVGSESGLSVSTKPLQTYAPTERIHFSSQFGDMRIVPWRTRTNCLVADLDGWIWQGTGGEGLYRYRLRDDRLETKSISTDIFDSGRNEAVTSLLARRDGSVWVALESGLWIVFGQKGSRRILDPQHFGQTRKPIMSMSEGPTGRLWIGYYDGSLAQFDPTQKKAFSFLVSGLKERIISVLESSKGELWAASLGAGLMRYSVDNSEKIRFLHPADGLLSELWALVRGEWFFFQHSAGVPAAGTTGLEIDSEGRVWIKPQRAVERSSLLHVCCQTVSAEARSAYIPCLYSINKDRIT